MRRMGEGEDRIIRKKRKKKKGPFKACVTESRLVSKISSLLG
jgi:hypothetical protein